MRSKPIVAFLMILMLALSLGCANRNRSSSGFDADSLWKQGYGFNNPNPQRLKDGLAPVNFDGRTDKHSIVETLIGESIGLVGQSLWDAIRR